MTRLIILAFIVLGACAQTQEAVDNVARTSAKATVSKVVATELPGVPQSQVTPYSDCIIDSASAKEILLLSKAAVTGVQPDTITLVKDIVGRTETLNCIASAALSRLQG